jgi:hypothetical protein
MHVAEFFEISNIQQVSSNRLTIGSTYTCKWPKCLNPCTESASDLINTRLISKIMIEGLRMDLLLRYFYA